MTMILNTEDYDICRYRWEVSMAIKFATYNVKIQFLTYRFCSLLASENRTYLKNRRTWSHITYKQYMPHTKYHIHGIQPLSMVYKVVVKQAVLI